MHREIVKKNIICQGASAIIQFDRNPNSKVVFGFAVALMLIDSYSYGPSCPIPSGNFDERDAKKWLRNSDWMTHSLVKYFNQKYHAIVWMVYTPESSVIRSRRWENVLDANRIKKRPVYTYVLDVRELCTAARRANYHTCLFIKVTVSNGRDMIAPTVSKK